MFNKLRVLCLLLLASAILQAQKKEQTIEAIIQEVQENSQAVRLGHELIDVIGLL